VVEFFDFGRRARPSTCLKNKYVFSCFSVGSGGGRGGLGAMGAIDLIFKALKYSIEHRRAIAKKTIYNSVIDAY
jgi:hypothetical protein